MLNILKGILMEDNNPILVELLLMYIKLEVIVDDITQFGCTSHDEWRERVSRYNREYKVPDHIKKVLLQLNEPNKYRKELIDQGLHPQFRPQDLILKPSQRIDKNQTPSSFRFDSS